MEGVAFAMRSSRDALDGGQTPNYTGSDMAFLNGLRSSSRATLFVPKDTFLASTSVIFSPNHIDLQMILSKRIWSFVTLYFEVAMGTNTKLHGLRLTFLLFRSFPSFDYLQMLLLCAWLVVEPGLQSGLL